MVAHQALGLVSRPRLRNMPNAPRRPRVFSNAATGGQDLLQAAKDGMLVGNLGMAPRRLQSSPARYHELRGRRARDEEGEENDETLARVLLAGAFTS